MATPEHHHENCNHVQNDSPIGVRLNLKNFICYLVVLQSY